MAGGNIDKSKLAVIDTPAYFGRSNGQPLDITSIQANKAAIQTYAATAEAYKGQICTDLSTGDIYVLTGSGTDNSIKKVGIDNIEYDEELDAIKFVFN